MGTTYALSTFLRQTPKPLLRRYFARRGILEDVAFDDLRRNEFSAIVAGLDQLTDADRAAVDSDFQDIDTLADKVGTRIIMESAALYGSPAVLAALEVLENHYARAMWLFLECHDDLYDLCRDLVEVESIRFSKARRRNHLPHRAPACDEAVLAAMEAKVKALYQAQGRGRRCHVACFERHEPKRFYYVAYPEDYATSDLHYEGNELQRRPRRAVFDVALLFRPDDGTLEIHAPGKRDEVDSLYGIFCETALGGYVPPEGHTAPTYRLAKVVDRNFAFATDAVDGIDGIDVLSMRLHHGGVAKRPRITFEPEPCGLADFMAQLSAHLARPVSEWVLAQVKLRATFAAVGKRKARTVTFTLTAPDTSDLKDSRDHLVLKRYLSRWGLAA